MESFDIVAGIASIVSLIISAISLAKVSNLKKIIRSKQAINNTNADKSNITQIGGDNISNEESKRA